MKHISNFSDNTKEITKALGVLNDHAVKLYQQYSNRLEEAMRILSVKLQRECAPDPKHSGELIFTFTYSENIERVKVSRTKDIECSPHLKLLHPGSNLRIYFIGATMRLRMERKCWWEGLAGIHIRCDMISCRLIRTV